LIINCDGIIISTTQDSFDYTYVVGDLPIQIDLRGLFTSPYQSRCPLTYGVRQHDSQLVTYSSSVVRIFTSNIAKGGVHSFLLTGSTSAFNSAVIPVALTVIYPVP
jgi:hypothetical protein